VTRGYTLIELVVVLLVLAVAAAVAAPAVGRTADRLKARAEAAAVANFLRSAREQAVTRQEPYEVVLDADARALLLRPAGPRADGRVQAARAVSPRVRIEAEPLSMRRIIFLPQGMSSGGHLRIEMPGSSPYVVTVDRLTGRVATHRGAS